MNRFKQIAARVVILYFASCAAPVSLAHHTWVVEYERDEVIILEATVSKLQIMSPHSRIFLDVEGSEEIGGTWLGETWPLAQLYRRGLTKETLAIGDKVSERQRVARDFTFEPFFARLTVCVYG